MRKSGIVKHERNTEVYTTTVSRMEKSIRKTRVAIFKWDDEGRDYTQLTKVLRHQKQELAKYLGEFVTEFTTTRKKTINGYMVESKLGMYTVQRVLVRCTPLFSNNKVWFCDDDEVGTLKEATEYAINDTKRELQIL